MGDDKESRKAFEGYLNKLFPGYNIVLFGEGYLSKDDAFKVWKSALEWCVENLCNE